ncbi:MAG: hypothetical protein IJO82_02840, partial [Clostridia bacterium]|nr:hypothetical protein [Clostridia bacterium]
MAFFLEKLCLAAKVALRRLFLRINSACGAPRKAQFLLRQTFPTKKCVIITKSPSKEGLSLCLERVPVSTLQNEARGGEKLFAEAQGGAAQCFMSARWYGLASLGGPFRRNRSKK